jgi:hypothetical protein
VTVFGEAFIFIPIPGFGVDVVYGAGMATIKASLPD